VKELTERQRQVLDFIRTVGERHGVPPTAREIGEKFGFSPQQMSDELKAIGAEWRAATVRRSDEAKARELAKLDNLEREYWEAWQRSREQAKKTKQNADPWFLEGIERCIGIRCELRGLLAPKRTLPHSSRRR